MCAIVGAVVRLSHQIDSNESNRILNRVCEGSIERGRDGFGFTVLEHLDGQVQVYDYTMRRPGRQAGWAPTEFFSRLREEYMPADAVMLGNFRAEPTTEYVRDKQEHDQQPYRVGSWSIAHNGTIANDRTLRTGQHPTSIDSASIAEQLDQCAQDPFGGNPARQFIDAVGKLRGSYAIIAVHDSQPDTMFVAANYRPVWYARNAQGTFFASARHYFPDDLTPVMLEPYTCWAFTATGATRLDQPLDDKNRALVVCSGGLDSVVAATAVLEQGMTVELLHFRYGSRAEGPEVAAVQAVAHHLGVNLVIAPMDVYDPADSPLLRADSTIAGGEAGAEFAHEWVPARNLVMLSLATAMAEARGFDTVVLGNNLEEAGAYPDNEPEFIARFNDLLPFATGDGRRVRVVMPVGNLMKHEIVDLGTRINAPLALTWSCYRSGPIHCGRCGPCVMRRTAFEINGFPEVIQYASKEG